MNYIFFIALLSLFFNVQSMEKESEQLTEQAKQNIIATVSPQPLFCDYSHIDEFNIGINHNGTQIIPQEKTYDFTKAELNFAEKSVNFDESHYNHPSPISFLSYSPTENNLITVGGKEIKLWQSENAHDLLKVSHLLELPKTVAGISWHPSGEKFALIMNEINQVRVYPKNRINEIAVHQVNALPTSLYWNDNHLLIGTKNNGIFALYDSMHQENIINDDQKTIAHITSNGPGTILAYVAEENNNVSIKKYKTFDVSDNETEIKLKKPTNLRWSDTHNILTALSEGKIYLIKPEKSAIVSVLQPQHNFIRSFDVQRNTPIFASLSSNGGIDIWHFSHIFVFMKNLFENLSDENIKFLNEQFKTTNHKKILLWALDQQQERQQKEDFEQLPEAYRTYFNEKFLVEHERPASKFSILDCFWYLLTNG